MKAFVTGITGFAGSHLSELLIYEGIEVHGLCRWRSAKDNIIHILDHVTLHHGDLLDLSSLMTCINEVKPDFVFHLAAQSYVPYSFRAPAVTLETNVTGTANLLEAIRLSDCDPVIDIASSSEVYGQVNKEDVPIKETCRFQPASPYAVSKVGTDTISHQYYMSYGLKTIRTRNFTFTGPRRGEVFVVSNFAKQIASISLGLQDPKISVGNLDSVRTFADVRDTVRAYWDLVNMCEAGEVYNIGGERTMTIGEMLNRLIDLSPVRENIEVVVDKSRLRPSDVTLQIPCLDKFKNATGWKPKYSFDQTLTDTLYYWRDKLGRQLKK